MQGPTALVVCRIATARAGVGEHLRKTRWTLRNESLMGAWKRIVGGGQLFKQPWSLTPSPPYKKEIPPVITTRITKSASAAAFVLAATMGLATASVVPAQSAVALVATATTTTAALASPTVAYGETATLSVAVDSATNGSKPTGKVTVTVSDQSLTADIGPSGKVDFDLPLLDASTTPYAVTATFTPTDSAAFSPSTAAPVSVTVTKDATTSTVTAIHNTTKNKVVAKNLVTATFLQVPTGTAKFILRRNGIKIASSIVTLNSVGKARAVFRKLPDTGTYKVVSRYRGSPNFLRSKGSFKIPS